MQKGVLKIAAIMAFLMVSATGAIAQTSSFRLYTADSLFRAKQFTQSLRHYEAMLENKEFTPAMLLKMAYIHEGLATKSTLGGYTVTDADRLISWYIESREYISFALAPICILLLALAFHR